MRSRFTNSLQGLGLALALVCLGAGCEQSGGTAVADAGGIDQDMAIGDSASDTADSGGASDVSGTTDVASSDIEASDIAGDISDADTSFSCPSQAPQPNAACSVAGPACNFGQECCCGTCYPSMVCQCTGTSWMCYATDACMIPPDSCSDTAQPDTAEPDTTPVDTAPQVCNETSSSLMPCPDAMYCAKPEGQCGGNGVCKQKPSGCSKEYMPVCGCNGITYGNLCAAASAGVAVHYSGTCKEVTKCQVGDNSTCKESQFCIGDAGQCSGEGQCATKPEVCPMVVKPVCGCDGNSYGNSCEAAASGVVVALDGECPAACDASSNSGCAKSQFCLAPDGQCGGKGMCVGIPQACDMMYQPVCGCDGKTYGNACSALIAGAQVAAKGACSSAKLQYYLTCGAPVCGGWTDKGIALCTKEQQVGGACSKDGEVCDPKDGCNALLKCTSSDPKQQPGGCPISKAKYKSDIQYVQKVEAQKLADRLLAVKLATYRYTAQGPQGARHLGFIIDDDPQSPAVDAQRDMVDLYGYLSMAVATLQQQQAEIRTLKAEVQALKNRRR